MIRIVRHHVVFVLVLLTMCGVAEAQRARARRIRAHPPTAQVALMCALSPGSGTVHTVKTSGGDYSTPSACANASSAGDICEVYTGSFAGGTITASGSSLSAPITIRPATGQSPTITSKFVVTDRSYLLIRDLTFTGTTGMIYAADDADAGHSVSTSYIDVCHNTSTASGTSGSGFNAAVVFYGDHLAFEYNDVSIGAHDQDFVGGAGAAYVFRGNKIHTLDAGGSTSEHSDMNQVVGGSTTPQMNGALFENNFHQDAISNVGNVHTLIIRGTSAPGHDNVIIRYNVAQHVDTQGPWCIGCGASDIATHVSVYHNTSAGDYTIYSGNGGSVTYQGTTTGGLLRNNISYNENDTSFSPYAGITGNGDIVYNCTPTQEGGGSYGTCTPYSGSWGSPYSAESTYATNRNIDPGYTNYPTDVRISANAGPVGKGVALTTANGAGVSTTSLVVVTSYPFFPGWGNIQADTIQIGSNTPVQITANNTGTNTLTLASAQTWSNGDPIYLYALSDGTRVRYNSSVDVGACPGGQTSGLIGCGGTAQGR